MVKSLSWRDIMQVCLKGHVFNDSYKKSPSFNKNFCDKCGSKTIIQCPKCNEEIPGKMHFERSVTFSLTKTAPEFCQFCGNPYPWTSKKRDKKEKNHKQTQYKYDVALSFAGENREYVEEVHKELVSLGMEVFYDEDEDVTVDTWGKDLVEYFDEVFRKKAKYCVIFISEFYAKKRWTTHEKKSALARTIEQKGEYILPVRFDYTELPGLQPTIKYLNAYDFKPEKLAKLIKRKCT